MKILAIDYGRRKLGLAVSDGSLASPYKVLKVGVWEEVFQQVGAIAQKLDVERLLVGVSEGEMAKEQREFASNLSKRLKVPVILWDETLSTKDAVEKSIQAGVKREKRRKKEDSFAAAVILQNYLDSSLKS